MFSTRKSMNSAGPFLFFCSLIAASSISVLISMLVSPSEPGNSILFGLSLPRLVFAGGLLFVFVVAVALWVRGFRNQPWAEQILERWFGHGRLSKATAWIASIGFGLGWIGTFLPTYRAGFLMSYWPRIQPLMMFILLFSASTLVILLWMRSTLTTGDFKDAHAIRLGLILFSVCIAIFVVMLGTKYGVSDREDFWYGAGVPLLASQLLTAILAGVVFLLFGKNWNTRRLDLWVFLLIYAVTAILWAREPLQKSFLFIGPYPPDNVLYPFADAATFDAASQFALIGQRIFIFNSPFFERSLYLSFLVYLHSLFGQDYQVLMMAQAAVFAVLPALVFLIGRSLNMRAVGFASAVIAMLRGVNSIAASNMIDLANPKMMLTDFPTAIGVALLVLFTCEWLRQSKKGWQYALWAGGAIGMTLMLRTNALVFLLFIPLLALLSFGSHWKKWLRDSVLLLLAVVAITIPWELRNASLGGMMYASITAKIQNVIRERYTPRSESGSLLPSELSSVTLQTTQVMVYLNQDADPLPCTTVECFAPKHFLHNVVTSILVLPTSPSLDDVRHTVKDNHPFWRPDWDGVFTPSSLFFFIVNLFLIVLGIALAWRRQRWVGITPLAIFMFYNVSNALARTSGGRYIVPVDWILSLYFVLAALYLTKLVAGFGNIKLGELVPADVSRPVEISTGRSPWITAAITLGILVGIGSLLPLSEALHSPRFSDTDAAALLDEHQGQLDDAGLSLSQIQSFLQNPDAELVVGRALYPRFFQSGRGEMHFYPYTEMGFPRTGFVLIGPAGQQAILLPGESPSHLPHGADVLVLGCQGTNYTDALAVVILDETNAVYARSPASALTCPLRQPVCDNNHVCR